MLPWMDLDDIMLIKKKQNKTISKGKYCLIPLTGYTYNSQRLTEQWSPGPAGGELNIKQLMFNGDRVSAGEDVKALWVDGGDGCVPARMSLMAPNCAPKTVKVVKLMRCIYFTTIKNK